MFLQGVLGRHIVRQIDETRSNQGPLSTQSAFFKMQLVACMQQGNMGPLINKTSLQGQEYRSAFTLYSVDGKRAVEALEFRTGEIYLDERESLEGNTFANGHSGSLVGPFASLEEAEKFIVATSWFRGSPE